jgi:hypothetical protein
LKDANEFVRLFKSFTTFVFAKNEQWRKLSVVNVLRKITQNHYPLIGEYLEQFVNFLKAGTLLNYWNCLLISLRWYHFDCDLNTKRCKGHIGGFENYMKRLRKAYTRAKKKEFLNRNKTHEKLVEEGRLPSGGIQELYKCTQDRLAWVVSLKAEDFKNRKVYNAFTDWLYSVFWVGMFQGRKGGLEDMKYSQRHGLLNPNGNETTTNFKTALSHGAQALSGHHLFSIGMKVYLEKARPQVATEEMYDENAPLFLTFQNGKEYRTGNKVIILSSKAICQVIIVIILMHTRLQYFFVTTPVYI